MTKFIEALSEKSKKAWEKIKAELESPEEMKKIMEDNRDIPKR